METQADIRLEIAAVHGDGSVVMVDIEGSPKAVAFLDTLRTRRGDLPLERFCTAALGGYTTPDNYDGPDLQIHDWSRVD